MRFNCGPTPEERHERAVAMAHVHAADYRTGYVWFAWYPVRVGSGDCRWLEKVYRRYPDALVSSIFENYGWGDAIVLGTPTYEPLK